MKKEKISGIAALAIIYSCTVVSSFADFPQQWKSSNTPPTNSHLNAVTYGNGKFFAGGSGFTVLSSQHGLDWTLETNGTDSSVLRAIAIGESAVAAGGQLGAFLTSSADGSVWTNQQSAAGVEAINGMIFAEGVFVAVGHGTRENTAYILTSTNAVEWVARRPITTNE